MSQPPNQPVVSATARIPGKGTNDWFTPGRFAGLLGLLIVVCFPQVVTGLEAFMYEDAGWFAYPVAFHLRESFWRGEVPLWNPLNNCGTPFLAQWNTMALYPPSLFYVLFPVPWSFGIFCLGHLFLAGMGMYFLAHRWTGNRLAAAAAGSVFAFNGLTWYGLMWPHMLAALAWMPWVVLATARAWCKGGRWIVFAALAGAMQMLTGGAEVIIQTWLLLALAWFFQLSQGKIPRFQLTMRALAVVLLVAGLAAAQLLPFLDLLAHSQRNTAYGGSMLAALPLSGLANYLVPLFHCVRNPQGVFVHPDQTWTSSYYLGIGAVALALIALWRSCDRRVWFLGAITVASLLMALGGHTFVYDWVKRLVPLLGLMRFPAKFVITTTFAIPLLAAFGLASLQSTPADGWPRERRNLGLVGLALAGLMAVIVWCACEYPLPHEQFTTTLGNAVVRALFLVLILGCLAFLRRETSPWSRWLGQLLLIGLLWFDVLTHAPDLSPSAARSVAQPDLIRQSLDWGDHLYPGDSRTMQSRASFWKLLSTAVGNLELDTYGRRLALFNDLNLLDHAAKFDGFYSLDLNEYEDVFKQLYFGINESSKLKDFLGLSLTSDPNNPVAWVPRTSALPIITAGQAPVFADATNTFRSILGEGFAPLSVVYLPPEAEGVVGVSAPVHAHVAQQEFSAQRVRFTVTSETPAMVVIAQAWYHWWHAYVDGKQTTLWRANYAFQALEVPAGSHEVTVVYEDAGFFWGAILSVASLLACAVIWLRTSRRHPEPDPSQNPGA
jgi:hypothetical protein